MQTAFAVDLPEKGAQERDIRDISVAIAAESANIRSKIEALARRSGALVVGSGARYDILLAAIDESTPPELLREVTHSSKTCAIWTSAQPPGNAVLRIFRAGLASILWLESTSDQCQAGLKAIQADLQVTHPEFIHNRSTQASDAPSSLFKEELTDREQQVLGMMAEGLSNKEISARLAISAHTVKFHISSILGKLDATSRTEAVSIGVRTGRVVI
jgi:DNA-binding NarL/FixJ family response regulator